MGKCETVALGELGTFQTGGTPTRSKPDYFRGTLPWITTTALGQKYIGADKASAFISPSALKESATKLIPEHSILIGARVGVGKVSINTIPICINQDIVAISNLDSKRVLPEYLQRYLETQKEHLNTQKRGATIQGIRIEVLKEMMVPVPPLPIQQKIADVLDKASALIEMRKAQIEKLDLLIKSQFIEMFGDPVSNPKGWEKRSFADICEIITDGEHATPRRVSKGIYLLSARNVTNHQLLLNQVDFIDEVEYMRISKRIVPKEDDILLSCSGSIGRCCRVPRNLRLQLVRSVALLRLKSYLNPIFVEYLISSDYVQNQIDSLANKSSQANLFQGSIKKLIGIVPSHDEQVKFANFVELIGEQKKAIKESLSLLEHNYSSLMQKCFTGEMNFDE